VRLDQLAHEVADAHHKFRLALAAVRKEGVIGDVKVTCVRPRLGDLAENGQSAETGIEDENGRCHGGSRYEKNLATLSTGSESAAVRRKRSAPGGSQGLAQLLRVVPMNLTRSAFGFDRRLAEHALEDRIDVLEMMVEVEVLLEFGLAEMLAHVLVG
jgi:hypothetical protein